MWGSVRASVVEEEAGGAIQNILGVTGLAGIAAIVLGALGQALLF